MIVAGIGCRKGASGDAIEAALAAAFVRAGIASTALALIATAAAKAGEPGIVAAAAARRVPLRAVAQPELVAAGARTISRSARVAALAGVPCLAEAAALAAGGAGARLVAARIAVGPATCALAEVAAPVAAARHPADAALP